MPNVLTSMLDTVQQARSARTSVVATVLVVLGMLLSTLVALVACKAPDWVIMGTAGASSIVLLFYMFVFWHFATSHPDGLRTEHYLLNRLAMEKGLVGDDSTGLQQRPRRKRGVRVQAEAPAEDDAPSGERSERGQRGTGQ